MPISAAQLQQLKRTNISVDGEKTRQRTEELWKGLKIKQKQAVKELADISFQTIYRVYNTGGISIKTALALAQELNVSPYYLTGETDEPGAFSDGAMLELLQKYGYKSLLTEMQPAERQKRKYTRRETPEQVEATVEEEPAEEAEEEPAPPPVPEPQLPPGSDALTAEDLQQLLFALYVQAKAGIANSKEKLEQIKQIILL